MSKKTQARKQELLGQLELLYGGDMNSLADDLSKRQKLAKKIHYVRGPTAPVIARLDNVAKTYKMGKVHVSAVKDVSFAIHEAEIVALIGPSGSGKSSILNLIGGLDRPNSGTVSINNKDLKTLNDKQLSRFRNQTIGFIFQFFYLQPFLDLETNVQIPMMFGHVSQTVMNIQKDKLIESVGLTNRKKHLPNALSGGQIQRTAIARALVNNPKLLLADEPTGNLDRKNGNQIMDLFEDIRQKFNTAILLVTHDEKVAARADRVIELEDGAIV